MTFASIATTIAKYTAGATITASVLASAGLWWYQCSLIYPSYVPEGSRKNVPKPSAVGLAYMEETLTTPDQVKLQAYIIPARRKADRAGLQELQGMSAAEREKLGKEATEEWAKEAESEDALAYAKSRPTVVIFHANAGNMGHRIPLARKFNVEYGCNVFMLSYRGYGLSEGKASEAGIKIDVETALEYVTNHKILGGTKIILFGQSIGGAVCLYAAAMHPDVVSGVIIENTFLSLATLIPLVLPQLPTFVIPLLLTERWDAAKTLPKIPADTPMLFLSGRHDKLVPPIQMATLKRLRQESKGKMRWKVLDGEHNDTYMAKGYWEEVQAWLKEDVGVESFR